MTLFEAIKSDPTLVNVPNGTIEAAFITRDFDRTLDFSNAVLKEKELVCADLYVAIAMTPDMSEGDLSLKFNMAGLKARANSIYLKWEDANLELNGPTKINVGISKV